MPNKQDERNGRAVLYRWTRFYGPIFGGGSTGGGGEEPEPTSTGLDIGAIQTGGIDIGAVQS